MKLGNLSESYYISPYKLKKRISIDFNLEKLCIFKLNFLRNSGIYCSQTADETDQMFVFTTFRSHR